MAVSTNIDDLARQVSELEQTVDRLAALLAGIELTFGIGSERINRLSAGGAILDEDGISLPLADTYLNPAALTWGPKQDEGSSQEFDAEVRAYTWGSSNRGLDIKVGSRRDSTSYQTALLSIYAYARASTGGSSGYNVFMDLNATDADGEVLHSLTNGLRGTIWNTMFSARKNGAGSTGGISVGIGTYTPTTGAMLDVYSTRGSLLVPRLTSAQKDTFTPVDGMIYFNSDSSRFEGYVSGWKTLTSG